MKNLTLEELEAGIVIKPSASNSFNATFPDDTIKVDSKGPTREIVWERWFAKYYEKQFWTHKKLAERLSKSGDEEGAKEMMDIANNHQSLYSKHTKAGKRLLKTFMAEMEKERQLENEQ